MQSFFFCFPPIVEKIQEIWKQPHSGDMETTTLRGMPGTEDLVKTVVILPQIKKGVRMKTAATRSST